MRERLTVNERQFRIAAYVALAALTAIVFTGAAVRLSNSGLGCPTWPKCYGKLYPPVALHPLIEFSNRAISGIVGVVTVAIFVLALRRRPFRRDLVWLSALLPIGVLAQAVLGGFTVREKLAPGFVMSHFLLSMVLLVAAMALAWRATYQAGHRPPSNDRLLVYSVRFLAVMCALTLVAGTVATGSGPHSGGLVGQHVKRFTFKGADTLEWAVNQHATIAAVFGVLTILVWLLKRSRGHALDPLEPLTVLGVLLAAQGLVGAVQYELKLPGQMVWVHVVLATLTWLTTLWAVATEGQLARRGELALDRGGGGGSLDTIVTEWSERVPAR